MNAMHVCILIPNIIMILFYIYNVYDPSYPPTVMHNRGGEVGVEVINVPLCL